MKQELIIIGGGGHAKVLIGAVRSLNEFTVIGILDPKLAIGDRVCGVPVIGTDEMLFEKKFLHCQLAVGFGSVKATIARYECFCDLKDIGYSFAIIKHSSAILDASVEIGEGTQLMAGVIVQPDSVIDSNCIINTGAVIEHDCRIGKNVHVAPGAVIGGGVKVGDHSMLGLGARVLPGVKIGLNVTIGAGAVVVRDTDNDVTMTGVPAKVSSKVL